MESNIYYHSECNFQLKDDESITKWIKNVINAENKELAEINYIFCDDQYLLKKNQEYLKLDTFTDIITFDYTEQNRINADIFISIERVKENAITFAVPFDNELRRVIIHGVLHLMGYKDKSKEDAEKMRNKENFYLSEKV